MLSAALDKNVSKEELMSVIEKYHDSYAKSFFDTYTQAANKELQNQTQ